MRGFRVFLKNLLKKVSMTKKSLYPHIFFHNIFWVFPTWLEQDLEHKIRSANHLWDFLCSYKVVVVNWKSEQRNPRMRGFRVFLKDLLKKVSMTKKSLYPPIFFHNIFWVFPTWLEQDLKHKIRSANHVWDFLCSYKVVVVNWKSEQRNPRVRAHARFSCFLKRSAEKSLDDEKKSLPTDIFP